MKGLWFAFGMVLAVSLAMWLELEDRREEVRKREASTLVEALLPVDAKEVTELRWRNFERASAWTSIQTNVSHWTLCFGKPQKRESRHGILRGVEVVQAGILSVQQ